MTTPIEKLAELLVQNRFMTVMMGKLSPFALACFKKNKIYPGALRRIVDCFIGEHVPPGLQARWILTKGEISDKDYVLDQAQDFLPLGYKLYKHRDVKRVVFIAPSSRNNAVFYYRMELPALKLWEHYFDIKSYTITGYSNSDIDRADIIIIHRFFKSQLEIVKRMKEAGKRVVFDTDDLLTCLSPVNSLSKFFNNPKIREDLIHTASLVDLVTVTTDILKGELLSQNGNVAVLRNKIDLGKPSWKLPKQPHDIVVVGYAGGPTHKYDLRIVSAAIIRACRSTGAQFLLCGYTKGGTNFLLNEKTLEVEGSKKVDKTPWDEVVNEFSQLGSQFLVEEGRTISDYPAFFTKMDIVLAPLEDNRFNRAKSELKMIEAGAYGLPVICSDVGPYTVLNHEVDGLKAASPGDFERLIVRLVKDPDLRKGLGSALRMRIEKEYDANDQVDRRNAYMRLLV